MALDIRDDELLGGPTATVPRVESPVVVRVPATTGGEQAIGGGFEGADEFDRALSLWAPPIQSADADMLPDKELGDARSRDMLRNDAYVQGAANLHKDNIVGAQFLLNARPDSRVIFGKFDDLWESEFQQEVEALWDLYAESPNNWIDASRTNTFSSLVRMAVGIHLASGEVLSTVEWDKLGAGEFKTTIQMIDLDRLSTPNDKRLDPMIRAGIRYDVRNAPVSYFIRKEHPHDYNPTLNWQMPDWVEVPIRKPWGRLQVIHIHEQVRPDQSRGFSEMLASLKAMRIAHKWRDINLQHALTQSIYAAAITSDLPSETVFAQLGGAEFDSAAAAQAVTKYATGYLSAIANYSGSAKNLQIDGVKIPHLFPGTKLEMLSPGKGGPLGTEFEQSILRYIAASVGVSYEQLSRDYTNTNYSSARAATNETWKFMQARKKLIAERFASSIFRLWLEEAINNNRLSTFPAAKAGRLYTNGVLNLSFEALSKADWIGAARGQIDELKETEAAILRIEGGLSTAEDELAKLGKDWRKVFRQLARERALRAELGLPDPQSKPSSSGQGGQAANSNDQQGQNA